MPKERFQFRQFKIHQDRCLMKVGTDGVLLGAWAGVEGVKSILDIGAGTGLIALMLAQRAPAARVHGVELDEGSANQAAENASASPWSERIQIIHGSIQEYAESCSFPYDLIASNPPFFRNSLKSPDAGRNKVRHAETLPFADLLKAVAALLNPDGRFCLILPPSEARVFEEMALSFGLFATRICEVCSAPGKPPQRVLMQFERESRPLVKEPELSLYTDRSAIRSAEYDYLTREFYLPIF